MRIPWVSTVPFARTTLRAIACMAALCGGSLLTSFAVRAQDASLDGKPVTDVQSFREALNKADPKRGVLLYLDRKGTKTFAVLKAGG